MGLLKFYVHNGTGDSCHQFLLMEQFEPFGSITKKDKFNIGVYFLLVKRVSINEVQQVCQPISTLHLLVRNACYDASTWPPLHSVWYRFVIWSSPSKVTFLCYQAAKLCAYILPYIKKIRYGSISPGFFSLQLFCISHLTGHLQPIHWAKPHATYNQ